MPEAGSPRTALILFTLSSPEEVRRKPVGLHAGLEARESLFRSLIDRTRSVLERARAGEVWISTPAGPTGGPNLPGTLAQRGSTFGQRFEGALRDAFDLGCERVLIVGNDSPELTSGLVRSALLHLARRRGGAVVGPSPDGGFYLLALDRAAWLALGRGDLECLPWCGPGTRGALVAQLLALGVGVKYLPEVRDLDTGLDLLRWLARRSSRRSPALRAVALRLLRAAAPPGAAHQVPPSSRLHRSFPDLSRPPPSPTSPAHRSARPIEC